MSFDEIGKITGTDVGAARGQMHRAMVKLRKHYKALTGGEIDDVE